jgi:predicted nucleic acid-binding protein
MRTFILDANALYSCLRKRPGSEVVEKSLHSALSRDETLLICSVNWGDVYYTVARQTGYREADRISQLIEQAPITIVDASRAQAEAAGRLKAGYGLHYEGCFAAALAGKKPS